MRFTVTLDADVEKSLKRLMSKDKLKFKQAVNQTLLRGFSALEAAEKGEKCRTIGGRKR
jgi:mRNA-degrading endonuclease RelE of RelBE toxin-antitoxin system